jgi:hypothetical protein
MGDARFNRPPRRLRGIAPPPEIVAADIAGIGHNGGPPLEEYVPEWGPNGIGNYFEWRQASEAAFNDMPFDTAMRRAKKAESLGLTFREYQLEILERGRFLQAEDTARITEIIARRKK